MAEQRIKYIIEFDVKTGQSQIQGLDGKLIATANSAKQLTAEVGMLSGGKDGAGGMEGLSKKTGGAASAALELGRVVSDAPYGIRGMANNVSQLSSQILYMSQQTDAGTGKVIGFGGALRGMFTALKGPLGVLLAIQVVIAAVDHFFGSTSKAKDGVDDLSSSLDELVLKFNTLSGSALLNGGKLEALIGSEKASIGVKILAKEFSDFGKKYKSLTEEQKKDPEILNDLVKKYGELLTVKARIENTSKEILRIEKEDPEEVGKIKALEDKLWLLYKQKVTLEEVFEVEKDTSKKSVKEFKQNLLDLSSQLKSFRDKEIQNTDISEEERLRLEYDASRKAVENKRLEFKEKEDARLKDKLKEINDSKSTEDEKAILIKDANQKYNEAQIQANEDLRSVMLQADIAYYAELSALRREDTEAAKEESKDLIAALTENNFDYQEFNETQKINAATNDLNRIQAELEGSQNLTNLKVSGLEKELLAEEGNVVKQQEIRNKIAKLNQDQTLYEEGLDKKRAIAKVGIAMQVSDAIAAIAGEGSGIAKGVAVAQTIWNTKQAFMAALGSAPYGPWNIAQALAVGVMGVKNVNDILATKAPNEKSADVSAKNAAMSGGGGGSAFNPNFNIVGASGSNQLAETVAGQIGEPTRAYVVYDDIATAGEIEANAIEASGI